MNKYESWGRTLRAQQTIQTLSWRHSSFPDLPGNQTYLPYGLGRSYGDSCLNDGGTLLDMRSLNHFIAFDEVTGVLECESGVSLEEVLNFSIPKGYFLSVTPGTRYVTVGGAIANDVHGKNHHQVGTFGAHVSSLELFRSDGERLHCSPEENPEWYRATIGGLGLTGIILSCKLRLKKISSAYIDRESVRFSNLEEFFKISEESDRDYEYAVAWIDCFAGGSELGRGIYYLGNDAAGDETDVGRYALPKTKSCVVPFDLPSFCVSATSMRLFNRLYYRRMRANRQRDRVHAFSFFYPLDSLRDWNRIYGARGFYQYQCVIPRGKDREALREILEEIHRAGEGSFLGVLKIFGKQVSPGMMSFPREGTTLALDFPNNGEKTAKLFKQLDGIVAEAGGAIYPAKDSHMSAVDFQAAYPKWEEFSGYIDPKSSSNFWRRVMEGS